MSVSLSRWNEFLSGLGTRSNETGGHAEVSRPHQGATMLNVLDAPSRRKAISAADWLDEQLRMAESRVVTRVVELTPELAQALLDRNPQNRKLSLKVTVAKYARDMANGTWAFNGEPIIIAKTGELNDGQHRCHAVIESNVTVPVVLVIGTERESRLTVDQGKTRMAGDYLGMEGYTDSIALAAAAKYAWQHQELGRVSHQALYSPTKGEIVALVDATPELAASLRAIPKKGVDMVGGRSILAFLHWLFATRSGDTGAADDFMDGLITGINLSADSPILYTRNRLSTNKGRLRPNEKAELIIRAWNAWRRGQHPRTMPINGGDLPKVER